MRASSVSDARSMQWDPLMIRWCLYLRHLSSSAYEMLRETGVLHKGHSEITRSQDCSWNFT